LPVVGRDRLEAEEAVLSVKAAHQVDLLSFFKSNINPLGPALMIGVVPI
jgi:hypothetical protein